MADCNAIYRPAPMRRVPAPVFIFLQTCEAVKKSGAICFFSGVYPGWFLAGASIFSYGFGDKRIKEPADIYTVGSLRTLHGALFIGSLVM